MTAVFINSFILFFVTIDAIGNLPFFLSLTDEATNFDGGSCRFINNKDTRTNDDSKDSYVLYPKHTIRGNTDYITL